MSNNIITIERLQKWRNNSIYLARRIPKYDGSLKVIGVLFNSATLDYLKEFAMLKLVKSGLNFSNDYFGVCTYDHQRKPIISVYDFNISTMEQDEKTMELTRIINNSPLIHHEKADLVRKISEIPQDNFFEIYNQSGMDMLLIGHAYNNLSENDSTIGAARDIQLKFACIREENRGRYWGDFSKFLIASYKQNGPNTKK